MRRLAAMVGQRLKIRLRSRIEILGAAVGNVLGTFTGLLFVLTLLHRTPALAGWTQAEVAFVWGFSETVVGLFYVLFSGLAAFNRRYLLEGELDRCLLRPVDPLVQVLVDNLSPEDAPSIVVGILAMAWAAPATGPLLLLLPVWLLAATASLGGMAILFSSLGFRLRHRGTTFGLLLHLNRFARWPVEAFPLPIRVALLTVVPVAWTGFVPASFFLAHGGWTWLGAAAPLFAVASMSIGVWAWRRGLRSYTSAGT
jgi:ABC-2 type transport system permease protein